MYRFRIRVPATSANLGPGFDVIGMALSVYNEFEVESTDSGRIRICIEGEGKGKIPENEKNILQTAMKSAFKKNSIEPPGLNIKIHNRIPVARGMGSSATAVLAGLLIAGKIIGEGFSQKDLINLAISMEGHPDNLMAAYLGGIVITYKEDDDYKGIRIIPGKPLRIALAIPDLEISTKYARSVLPQSYSLRDCVDNLRNVSLLIHSLQSGEYELLKLAMEDRIHQPYRMTLIPGFYEAKKAAIEAGAYGVAISGSGSTVIALCDECVQNVAESMVAAFEILGISCRKMVTVISNEGSIIE